MNLFLCSHFSSVGSLIEEEIENKKVAFIPTASLREGYIGYVGADRKLFKKLGAILTEIDIATEAYSTIQSVFEDVYKRQVHNLADPQYKQYAFLQELPLLFSILHQLSLIHICKMSE